ncbi:hypothetical protein [Serratia sp. BFP-2025]|uniref:hypothetical protein n=1 Tax=Serratia sp. BFP-2025 TaxID=3433707 RepID=UPI003D7F1635
MPILMAPHLLIFAFLLPKFALSLKRDPPLQDTNAAGIWPAWDIFTFYDGACYFRLSSEVEMSGLARAIA